MSTDQASSPDEWVSITDAAQRLGVSIVTVRRRIKQGMLEAELDHGRYGQEYRVRMPAKPPVSTPDHGREPTPTGDQTDDQTAHLIRLQEQYRADLMRLEDRLQERDERIQRLHEELRSETASASGTKARAELLEAEVERLRAELERARRPWWRRWLSS